MNLEEFRAERTFMATGTPGEFDDFPNGGEATNGTEPAPLPSYRYPDGLIIEQQSEGSYVLTIGNWIKQSADLAELEEDLYEWAKDEGYWDRSLGVVAGDGLRP